MGDDNKIHHEYERVVVSGEGATAREIRIYGSGGRLIFEGWQVADDSGQTAWISDAGSHSRLRPAAVSRRDGGGWSAVALRQLC